jgi:hypothetical protein
MRYLFTGLRILPVLPGLLFGVLLALHSPVASAQGTSITDREALQIQYEKGRERGRRGMGAWVAGKAIQAAGYSTVIRAIWMDNSAGKVGMFFGGAGLLASGTVTSLIGLPVSNSGLKASIEAIDGLGGQVNPQSLQVSWQLYAVQLMVPVVSSPSAIFSLRQLRENERAYAGLQRE